MVHMRIKVTQSFQATERLNGGQSRSSWKHTTGQKKLILSLSTALALEGTWSLYEGLGNLNEKTLKLRMNMC